MAQKQLMVGNMWYFCVLFGDKSLAFWFFWIIFLPGRGKRGGTTPSSLAWYSPEPRWFPKSPNSSSGLDTFIIRNRQKFSSSSSSASPRAQDIVEVPEGPNIPHPRLVASTNSRITRQFRGRIMIFFLLRRWQSMRRVRI